MLTLIFEGDAIVLAVERLVLDTADFLRTLVLDMVEMVKVVVVAYSRNFSDTSAKESGMASERWLRSVDGSTKVMSMSMVISCMVARLVPMTSKVSKAVAVTIVLMVSISGPQDVYDLPFDYHLPLVWCDRLACEQAEDTTTTSESIANSGMPNADHLCARIPL